MSSPHACPRPLGIVSITVWYAYPVSPSHTTRPKLSLLPASQRNKYNPQRFETSCYCYLTSQAYTSRCSIPSSKHVAVVDARPACPGRPGAPRCRAEARGLMRSITNPHVERTRIDRKPGRTSLTALANPLNRVSGFLRLCLGFASAPPSLPTAAVRERAASCATAAGCLDPEYTFLGRKAVRIVG